MKKQEVELEPRASLGLRVAPSLPQQWAGAAGQGEARSWSWPPPWLHSRNQDRNAQPSNAQCSRCQATDSVKSDKNTSENSEVAWQDPSSLAGRAMCRHPRGQQGGGPAAARQAEPPHPNASSSAQQDAPRPHSCAFPACWAGYLRAAQQVGEQWQQGRPQAGAAARSTPGPCSWPAHAMHTPAWLCAHAAQAGWAFLPTSLSPAGMGWAAGWQSWLLLRSGGPGPAQAEAPLPAAAAHTGRPTSGHAESPASAGADLWHLPALQTARLLGRLNHPMQGPRNLLGAGAGPRQDLCTRMK